MTKREAVVLSAYTGKLLCDFDDYHKYVESLFGCTIFTTELPMLKEDIQERAEEDAMQILKNLSDEEQETVQEAETEAPEQPENEEENTVQMVLN